VMGKKALCWLLLASFVLGPLPARADVNGFLDDVFNTMSTQTRPGVYEGQTRGYFTMGSFSARFPQDRVQLVSMQMPKVSFGCGGIDLGLGAFSYLSPEMLVEKLKMIIQSAAAFAFKMALSAVCKDCDAKMQELEHASDLLNAMNIDTCQAGQALAKGVWGWAGAIKGGQLERCIGAGAGAGSWSDRLSAKLACSSDVGAASTSIANPADKALAAPEGNIVWKALKRVSIPGPDADQVRQALMSLAGTVVVRRDSVVPVSAGAVIGYKDFINGSAGGLRLLECADGYDENACLNIQIGAPVPFKGMRDRVKETLQDILAKMQARETLTPQQVSFIESCPIPIYKALNVLSLYPAGVGGAFIEAASEPIAHWMVAAWLNDYVAKEIAIAVRSVPEYGEQVETVMAGLRHLQEEVHQGLMASAEQWKSVLGYIEYIRDLERVQLEALRQFGLLAGYGWQSGS